VALLAAVSAVFLNIGDLRRGRRALVAPGTVLARRPAGRLWLCRAQPRPA